MRKTTAESKIGRKRGFDWTYCKNGGIIHMWDFIYNWCYGLFDRAFDVWKASEPTVFDSQAEKSADKKLEQYYVEASLDVLEKK